MLINTNTHFKHRVNYHIPDKIPVVPSRCSPTLRLQASLLSNYRYTKIFLYLEVWELDVTVVVVLHAMHLHNGDHPSRPVSSQAFSLTQNKILAILSSSIIQTTFYFCFCFCNFNDPANTIPQFDYLFKKTTISKITIIKKSK